MGRYREKTCPTCGTTHRKQGIYCSRSCGNARDHSRQHKEHLSQKAKEHWLSDRSAEQREQVAAHMALQRKKQLNRQDEDLQELTMDDVYVPPVTPKPIRDDQFIADGDLWTEV